MITLTSVLRNPQHSNLHNIVKASKTINLNQNEAIPTSETQSVYADIVQVTDVVRRSFLNITAGRTFVDACAVKQVPCKSTQRALRCFQFKSKKTLKEARPRMRALATVSSGKVLNSTPPCMEPTKSLTLHQAQASHLSALGATTAIVLHPA